MKTEKVSETTVRVTFEWSNQHGDCYDCGAPAAYEIPGYERVCSVCAAGHAADGSELTRLFI